MYILQHVIGRNIIISSGNIRYKIGINLHKHVNQYFGKRKTEETVTLMVQQISIGFSRLNSYDDQPPNEALHYMYKPANQAPYWSFIIQKAVSFVMIDQKVAHSIS